MKEKELDRAEEREGEDLTDGVRPVKVGEKDITLEIMDDMEDPENDVMEEEDDDQEEPESELDSLRSENRELKNRMLRAHADLENFKKRSVRDRQESVRYANKDIFLQLLNVMDNFDRALLSAEDPQDNFVVGVAMIRKQLTDVLIQNGVEEISAENQMFDPYLHEAIASEETDEVEDNWVLEVFQRGYRFHGSLLRPAKVKVAVAIGAEPESSEEAEPEA